MAARMKLTQILHPRSWALWAVVAYLALAGSFVVYIGVQQRHIGRVADRSCVFTTFTRETQKLVIQEVSRAVQVAARRSRQAAVRRAYRAQLVRLQRLKARVEPPTC